jgi:hypothetical protein
MHRADGWGAVAELVGDSEGLSLSIGGGRQPLPEWGVPPAKPSESRCLILRAALPTL